MANVTALYNQTGQNPAILGATIDLLDWAGNPTLWVGPGDSTNLSINFADLLDSSTQAYKNWYATLDQVAAHLKQINGPVLFRPFPELSLSIRSDYVQSDADRRPGHHHELIKWGLHDLCSQQFLLCRHYRQTDF